MVNRGARSPEVMRTRSSADSRRSHSLDSRNSHFKPVKISSITAKHQKQKSSIAGTSEKRKIYQPPVLESGFLGRDDRGGKEYSPFSPGGASVELMTGKWNRVHSTVQGRTRGQIDASDHTATKIYPNVNRYPAASDHDDRTVSYYRERDSNSILERDYYRHGSQNQQQHEYVTDYDGAYHRSLSESQQSRDKSSQRRRDKPSNRSRGRSRPPASSQQRVPVALDNEYQYYDDDFPANPSPEMPITPRRQRKLNRWYQSRFPVLSKSESTMASGVDSIHTDYTSGPEYQQDGLRTFHTEGTDFEIKPKQEMSYFSFAMTAMQLLILMIQLFLCGLAPLEVNPMIGPFPAIFSEWGGKNPYLMVADQQWWRVVTPTFLHVGILHFIANAYCQLVAVAQFEMEWGSFKWIVIYIMSALGSSVFSNFFDSDSIAVTSSGAIMGMYAGKLAEVTVVSFFDSTRDDVDDVIRLDHISSVLCGLVLVSLLGSFTFIDWSANMGGLLIGFLTGLVVFSDSIKGCCTRFFWTILCFTGLVASLGYVSYLFYETVIPDDQLGDVCEYFRHMYPENADCQCFV